MPWWVPRNLAGVIDDRPGCDRGGLGLPQKIAVVAGADEADVLAVGLVGGAEPEPGGQFPGLGLVEVARRESAPCQLILAEHGQDVGLILAAIVAPQQLDACRRPDGPGRSGR